jgi:hypothetical protein
MPIDFQGKSLVQTIDDLEDATMRTGHRLAEDLGKRFRHNVEINTPVETRHLRDSYKLTPIRYGPAGGARMAVYAWQGTLFTEVGYAPYVEYGTGLWGPRHAKYKIEPKNPGGVLAFRPYMRENGSVILDVQNQVGKGGMITVRYVMHPGSPGAAMFRIGAVITEAEADEWSYQAMRMWENSVRTMRANTPRFESEIQMRVPA